jgi:hypothetical protein
VVWELEPPRNFVRSTATAGGDWRRQFELVSGGPLAIGKRVSTPGRLADGSCRRVWSDERDQAKFKRTYLSKKSRELIRHAGRLLHGNQGSWW